MFSLMLSASAFAQSVVVNKYQNSGTTNDIVELLVLQNNLDMRGMILKDFSGSMANDGGGKYQFSNNALWSSLPKGTLIVLRNNGTTADTTIGGSDYNLDIGMQDATYFSSLGGSFDIAQTEMVMIKAAGSDPAGVTGSIHALAGGTAGTQFNNAPVPKLRASGTAGTGQFVYANNSTQSVADFNGTDATGAATNLTFGAGNNANNTAFINALRTVLEPTVQASGITFSNLIANSLTLSWTNGNGASRIVVARQGSPVASAPVDGTGYNGNAAFGNGAQIGAGDYVLYSGAGNTLDVFNLAPNTAYYFAIFEFNGGNGNANYLATTPATASQTTSGLYSISGHIQDSGGNSVANVAVALTGSHTITIPTDSNGNYSFTGLAGGGTYTVTPSRQNYSFSPANLTIQNLNANGIGDFLATFVNPQTCSYTIAPLSQNFVSTGGTGSITINTSDGCNWKAHSNAAWIIFADSESIGMADMEGSGNASLNFIVRANGDNNTRTGTINIAGQTITFTQDAAPVVCSYTLTPTVAEFTLDGGTGDINISTLSECSWTAVSNDSWITITSSMSGMGNGVVSYSVASNSSFSRSGTITIGGETFLVNEQGTGTPPSDSEHMVMGNPTNAVPDVNQPLNYLMDKPQYVISYNRDRGIPNWVSWHLDTSWLGSASRQDDFRPDPTLPAGWYQVKETDYQGSGFDRGHHTPSADRTITVADNSATFYMTNMMPQAPGNNQGPWAVLEGYCRTLVNQGNELYIIAGGTGTGGTGSNGGVTMTIANGHVTVPAQTWKVIIVLPAASGDDVARVTTSTRVIAVLMPNQTDIRNNDWHQ
ncbi:MAG: DNA/RNA non-specific endonuclease, partial [Pyrinomonadaceae bacterium]